MSRLNKVALWNIGVVVAAMLATLVLVLAFPGTTIGMMGMVLLFGLFFGEKIFKGKDGPDWDEMENKIASNAQIGGYTVFWVAVILTAAFYPIYKGYNYMMPVAYLGFFPLFAAYLLLIVMSFAVLYQNSLLSKAKKYIMLFLATVILLIPPVLTGKAISENLIRQNFITGSEQRDEWHFNSTENILAESTIVLNVLPEKKEKIYMSLPYANGKINKVLFNGKEIESKALGVGEYLVHIPLERDNSKGNVLKVLWQFPIANMDMGEKPEGCPYRTRVRSLLPVDRIWITAILDEKCGYEVVGNPDKKEWRAVWNYTSGPTITGSCGFNIKKITNKEAISE